MAADPPLRAGPTGQPPWPARSPVRVVRNAMAPVGHAAFVQRHRLGHRYGQDVALLDAGAEEGHGAGEDQDRDASDVTQKRRRPLTGGTDGLVGDPAQEEADPEDHHRHDPTRSVDPGEGPRDGTPELGLDWAYPLREKS